MTTDTDRAMNKKQFDRWGDFVFYDFTEHEIRSITEKITALLKQKEEIVFGFLHGSFGAGTNVRDIDLAIWVDENLLPKTEWSYETDIEDAIQNAIHKQIPIDIRVLNNAPFYFTNNVFIKGVLLVSRDENLLTDVIERTSQTMINEGHYYEQGHKLIMSYHGG